VWTCGDASTQEDPQQRLKIKPKDLPGCVCAAALLPHCENENPYAQHSATHYSSSDEKCNRPLKISQTLPGRFAQNVSRRSEYRPPSTRRLCL